VAVLKANHLDVTLLASAIARLGAIPATLGWTHTPEFACAMLARLDKPFLVADSTQLQQCGLDQDAVAALTTRTITVDRTDRRDVVAVDDLRGAPPGRPRLRAPHERGWGVIYAGHGGKLAWPSRVCYQPSKLVMRVRFPSPALD
jgi:hypothetical protein